MILVTGGAGFIGTNFVLDWLADGGEPVVNLDKLTYAGNLRSLAPLAGDARHVFTRGDIGDAAVVGALLARHRPRAIVNFAAETHVDRSIRGPAAFVDTNVVGTLAFLECVREWWAGLPDGERTAFRFLHVSTDEVYGSLGRDDPPFCETTPYAPNSPYAASKAASDHLVRAYHHTYGLPTLTTNCSNNYGPLQFPEKLIPLMIVNALAGKPLPVYGDGRQVRDWLHVDDHADALLTVLARGKLGDTYCIGGDATQRNLDIVKAICGHLDAMAPANTPHAEKITFVTDRPGHDHRYAIDPSKVERECAFSPHETFETGLRKTVRFYLEHRDWVESVQTGAYRQWIDQHYAGRA